MKKILSLCIFLIIFVSCKNRNEKIGIDFSCSCSDTTQLQISEVKNNSDGQRFKLREGDIILEINKQKPVLYSDYTNIMKYINYGDSLQFIIDRNGLKLRIRGILKNHQKVKNKTIKKETKWIKIIKK